MAGNHLCTFMVVQQFLAAGESKDGGAGIVAVHDRAILFSNVETRQVALEDSPVALLERQFVLSIPPDHVSLLSHPAPQAQNLPGNDECEYRKDGETQDGSRSREP